MNNKSVNRTAPAKLGLLNIADYNFLTVVFMDETFTLVKLMFVINQL